MKKLTLLILSGLLCLALASCDRTKEESNTPNSISQENNNLYQENDSLHDENLIGTWILQEELEEGEEKPVSAICFFENGDCYNYYYNTSSYPHEYFYFVSRDSITNWYTNNKISLMVNNEKPLKYSITNDILTITDINGETQVFVKTNENLVDIIEKNEKWIDEFKDKVYAEYKKAYPYSEY